MVRFAAAALALWVSSYAIVAHAASDEIVLLDFWSPSCGPCMQMKPLIQTFIQKEYPIREIDTSRDTQTPRQFGVDRWPCFIMLVDGQEVDRHVGPIASADLQQMFEKAKDALVRKRRARLQSLDPAAPVRGLAPPPNLTNGFAAAPAPASLSAPAVLPSMAATPAAIPVANTNEPRGIANAPADLAVNSPAIGMSPTSPMLPAATAAGPSASADFPSNLLASTVRIRVEDSQGRSFGTGTIIDARSGEALIVTCGHLFRESKGKGPMTIETFDVSGTMPRPLSQHQGQLISYDLERDIAFIGFRPTHRVGVAQVAPRRTKIDRGDRVATIGCSNGQDPTLLPQRVNCLDRYQGPPNIEVSGAPEEGRSGGGLFNLQGQLIGVCYAADYDGKEGLYAALESIQNELDRLKLTDVYARSAPAAATADTVVRGQEPQDVIAPMPGALLTSGAGTSVRVAEGGVITAAAALPASAPKLSPQEQAAFGEIMSRAATSEVVVIVRPKAPGGESEVFTLDHATPEFVQALEARQQSAPVAVPR
ncbi:MAG: trypsin-like peptidase domain-containing protein [Pirellulales bacterium]|nr:trypsin-like peptidase domain-containing protein [Pirellulales bacterium]